MREDYEYTCEAMVSAARAGVRIVVGDDFGTPITPHGDYVAEMELYVKRLGLAPLEILQWATSNGAHAMGLGDAAGALEVGRLADLLVVDGDPSTEIACLGDRANLVAIMLGGEWIENRISGSRESGVRP